MIGCKTSANHVYVSSTGMRSGQIDGLSNYNGISHLGKKSWDRLAATCCSARLRHSASGHSASTAFACLMHVFHVITFAVRLAHAVCVLHVSLEKLCGAVQVCSTLCLGRFHPRALSSCDSQ